MNMDIYIYHDDSMPIISTFSIVAKIRLSLSRILNTQPRDGAAPTLRRIRVADADVHFRALQAMVGRLHGQNGLVAAVL